MLELIQDATAATVKVESLVQELPSPAATPRTPAVLLGDAKHLERICSELSRLNFYMSKGSSLPLVAALSSPVSNATSQLNAALRTTFAATLASEEVDAIDAARRCITSCCAIGNIALVHDTVRAVMMRPAIEGAAADTLTALAAGGVEAPAVAVELGPLLQRVKQRLEPLIARLGEAVADRSEVASSFDILGTCVLADVHALVKTNLPGAFSSAVPAAFHANYAAATSFLQWLAEAVPLAATLHLFQQSPARTAFMKEWNLAVYFSLRFQEIAGVVEEAFHTGPASAVAAKPQSFALQQSEALFAGLASCRDPTVTFPAVFERFYKLQLQLVLRYAAWVQEAGVVWRADGEGTGAGVDPTAANFSGFEVGSMQEWAQDAEPPALLQLLADLKAVVTGLRGEEAGRVAKQFDGIISSSDLKVISSVCFSFCSVLAS
jgi:conserved oligomeric Golgi complex subunit 2